MTSLPTIWRNAILLVLGCLALYFVAVRSPAVDQTAAPVATTKPQGWDDLVLCTPASSFDDMRTLTLWRDHTALIQGTGERADPKTLTWSLRSAITAPAMGVA